MFVRSLALSDTLRALRSGVISLVENIHSTCDRLEKVNPTIKAFLNEENRRERLLKEADTLCTCFPEKGQRPPLFGILVGVQDNIRIEGFPIQVGSKLPINVFEGPEADVITKLKQSGAMILGKTIMTEFAYLQPSPVRNPHHPEHTSGGSSAGAAAAVAAGLSPLTIGTQTNASIIKSAAYCGIVGYKPSYGRLSMEGVYPFAPSVDTLGFFTQDISGMQIVAETIIPDWKAHLIGKAKPVLALPSDAFLVQAECKEYNKFYKQIDRITAEGFELVTYPLFKDIKIINTAHFELVSAEFALIHKPLYKKYKNLYSELSDRLFKEGCKVLEARLLADRALQLTYRQTISEIMKKQGIDLWLSPAATSSAPHSLHITGSPLMSIPWTFTGLPSITIPVGEMDNGMPLGMQLVTDYYQDEVLLNYATRLQQIFY